MGFYFQKKFGSQHFRNFLFGENKVLKLIPFKTLLIQKKIFFYVVKRKHFWKGWREFFFKEEKKKGFFLKQFETILF